MSRHVPSFTARRSRRAFPSLAPALALALIVLAVGVPRGGPERAAAQDTAYDSTAFRAMKWRNLGPTRGGRSVAAAGIPGDRLTFYFGGTGGGVWKTEDAGQTWSNVSDGFFNTGSVGAIAVAESDPNVVWVGMGEHAVRGVTTSHGDGVYKSTDAGRTWTHMGLPDSRAISRIRIHPKNPERVYVAVQGAPYGETEERGIYRSEDGGETWEQILYVSPRAGASDLAMDMTNPRILYAAFWEHLRRPWVVESGGPGSGIWKSTDGGDSWTRIENGLPSLMGKIGIAVSRAEPDRVFAIIEAEPGEGGLYRSDDAGASWSHVNATREIQTRSWYYMEVYADPQDENTVYVMNAPFLKSVDAGASFERVQVPHGDEHDLWIDPTDSRVMINANDGGANVSFNGGESWSTQRNQPTAQFYRVTTDDRFPYHVYGGQQDNSAIGIPSAARGGVGWDDFYSVAGCESAYLAFDRDAPTDVFGGCYQGLIDVWNRERDESKPIMAYPFLGLGTYPIEQRYRFNWNAPIVASPHDPDVIYHAGNVVLRTEDRGQSWDVISPDLTRDQEERQGAGGRPITNEGAGGENYNTIMYLEPSPHERGTLWVGSDDGLVHLTRDGGGSWQDVTPDDLPEGMINSIEVSPHDPASAYMVFTRYKFNDFTPHVFRTDDYGESWTRIADGIAPEDWVRAVREDPEREGLLYAGTETGVYISFDDGESWHRWQLNLPVVPVTDLTIQGNDLVAATQGRAFWILDDLSPVRQITPAVPDADAHLYDPADAVIVQWGGAGGAGDAAGVGANPPSGAEIFFTLGEAAVPDDDGDGQGADAGAAMAGADEPEGADAVEEDGGAGDEDAPLVVLEILDADGGVIRTYASDPERAGDEDFSKLEGLEAGLNRAVWDFRRENITTLDGDFFTFGSTAGRIAPPGDYTVRLSAAGQTLTAPLTLRPDPRRDATLAQYREQDRFLAQATRLAGEIHASVNRMRAVRGQVEDVVERTADLPAADTIEAAGNALAERITDWQGDLIQPQQETFQDVINFRNKLNAQVLALIGSVDGAQPPVTSGARERLGDLEGDWAEHRETLRELLDAVEAFNRLVRESGIPPIVVPETEEATNISMRGG